MTAENELAKRLLNPRPAEESSEGAKLGSWMSKKKVWGKGKRKKKKKPLQKICSDLWNLGKVGEIVFGESRGANQ